MRIIYGLFLIAINFACQTGSRQVEVDVKPNIIIFISDDQSWLHAGAYGDPVVKTPAFDRIAAQGVLFENLYNSAPACAPSRAAMLTGKNFWELDEAAIHFSFFPPQHTTVADILAQNNYAVGYTGKGWAPGNWKGYRPTDPAGKSYQDIKYDSVPQGINKNHYAANFEQFYHEKGEKPFLFILGTTEPHRDLAKGMGLVSGKKLEDVNVPGFLPDHEITRSDILDYYYEIEWFDNQIGEVLSFLESKGELDNTVLIATSDNGMAFPRAKSNLYDYGSRLPLAISWSKMKSKGRQVSDFVNLKDFAPTILELCGIEIPRDMNGKSLVSLMMSDKNGRIEEERNHVVMGKELHGWCHPNGEINPVRAIRTDDYLYIQNLKPDLWPAGHPDPQYAWDLMPFGDVDGGPTKDLILLQQNDPQNKHYFQWSFGKRPAEELYDIKIDPFQLNNLAFKPGFQDVRDELSKQLLQYLTETKDPRILGTPETFEKAPYFWSHGLETAGLPLYLWDELTENQQRLKVDSVKLVLKNRIY